MTPQFSICGLTLVHTVVHRQEEVASGCRFSRCTVHVYGYTHGSGTGKLVWSLVSVGNRKNAAGTNLYS